jgi:hypothetical protein
VHRRADQLPPRRQGIVVVVERCLSVCVALRNLLNNFVQHPDTTQQLRPKGWLGSLCLRYQVDSVPVRSSPSGFDATFRSSSIVMNASRSMLGVHDDGRLYAVRRSVVLLGQCPTPLLCATVFPPNSLVTLCVFCRTNGFLATKIPKSTTPGDINGNARCADQVRRFDNQCPMR